MREEILLVFRMNDTPLLPQVAIIRAVFESTTNSLIACTVVWLYARTARCTSAADCAWPLRLLQREMAQVDRDH